MPPQIQVVQQPLIAQPPCGDSSCSPVMPRGCVGAQSVHPQLLQMQQNARQQATLQQLLSELKENRSQSQLADGDNRARQLQQQTRALEARVDQLVEMLEQREARPAAAPLLMPGPATSQQLPEIIERTGGVMPSRGRVYRSTSRTEMWPHSPQNQRRGY